MALIDQWRAIFETKTITEGKVMDTFKRPVSGVVGQGL